MKFLMFEVIKIQISAPACVVKLTLTLFWLKEGWKKYNVDAL